MLNDAKYIRDNLSHGFIEHNLESWDEYIEFISGTLLDFNHYIWRGQADSTWKLESTLSRMIINRNDTKNIQELSKVHLERFKYATRGRRGKNPSLNMDENDWWALGQHFGLSTPLLDWSKSPFVAAFFAFQSKDNNSDKRSIYALHQSKYIEQTKYLKYVKNNPDECISFINPLSNENSRLVNQNGLFTKLPLNISIEDWNKKYFKIDEEKVCLLKVNIPSSEREKVLKVLNRMNINNLTLFPDLTGASLYCNKCLEVKNY